MGEMRAELDLNFSEEEFLDKELHKVDAARKEILIFGYDPNIIENESYLRKILNAIQRGVKVGMILHKKEPLSKLEKLANNCGGIEAYRSNNLFLINEGFRTYDALCSVEYNKKRVSRYGPDRKTAFYRSYLGCFPNFFEKETFNYNRIKILKEQIGSL